ncbi:MAG: rod shape-determining protein MreC [Alphaproteobacteria bacterium]
MKQPAGQLSRLGTFRSLVQRFAFAALVTAAFSLMLVGKADRILVERLRTSVADALAPMLDALSRPAATVADVIDSVRNLAAIRAQNVELREANARLQQWQSVARELENENQSLRSLLNFVPGPQASFISARVIAETEGAFVRSALINAGTRAGVRKGQAVVTGEGLVGRIEEAGKRSARILLITDINSKIPVIVEPSRTRAILVSNNDKMQLIYRLGDEKLSVGDRVITAEDGHALPPDLPVGVVSSVNDNMIQVEPFVRFSQLEYVRLVDYGLTGILPSSPQGDDR